MDSEIRKILAHLVRHSTGYPTQEDRQAHLDALAEADAAAAEPAKDGKP
jgi:hypothetical protein